MRTTGRAEHPICFTDTVTEARYTVADHLLDRLASLGVRHLFGVPGDFTLAFLDHVEQHPLIEWVGCANELGAGYAADGYARLNGFGALSTTFGVGELSAVNAVAGSFAEHVPVVHIVGAPTRATQAAGRATHHSLGDGDFGHFARMSAEVTAAHAVLTVDNAAAEIDRVLRVARDRRLPVYVMLPADFSEAPIASAPAPLPAGERITDEAVLAEFTAVVTGLAERAVSLAVLADILVHRVGAEERLQALLAQRMPHATLLWGRRVVDESAPAYLGSYLGASSDPAVRAAIEEADLLVMAGVQFTDLTSGFFTQRLDPARTVEIRGESARIGEREFAPLAMADALDAVTAAVRAADLPTAIDSRTDAVPPASAPDDAALRQASLWTEVSASIRPGDTVLADQGTAFYGMADHRLPRDVVFVGQPLWASIGFALPALLGAALAQPDRRPVLLIGDGAAQLTIAELGTLLRHRIPAIIVLVDNSGYTVERVIHGLHEEYNDIAGWDWAALVAAMGPASGGVGVRVDTAGRLRERWSTRARPTG